MSAGKLAACLVAHRDSTRGWSRPPDGSTNPVRRSRRPTGALPSSLRVLAYRVRATRASVVSRIWSELGGEIPESVRCCSISTYVGDTRKSSSTQWQEMREDFPS